MESEKDERQNGGSRNMNRSLPKVIKVLPMGAGVLTLKLDAKYQEDPLLDLDALDQLSPRQEVYEEHCIVTIHISIGISRKWRGLGRKVSTVPIRKIQETTDLPGIELKSPQTSIGMSALAAIFSSPLRSV